jgi:hypothetical protein
VPELEDRLNRELGAERVRAVWDDVEAIRRFAIEELRRTRG